MGGLKGKTVIWSLLLVTLLLAGGRAWGQTPPVAAYQLRAGDTLEIVVAGEPAYSGPFLIGADGSILFSDEAVGKVMVAGQTVEAATTNLKTTLAQYLKTPMVSLRISKYRVLVVGEVKNPGSYEMAAGDTAMDAVARAGGGAQDLSLLSVQVQHGNGDSGHIDPNSASGPQNFALQPGDEVIVGPRSPGNNSEPGGSLHISIQGSVNNPGEYTVPAGSTFFQAMAKANGPTAGADLKKCSIIRSQPVNQVITLDLQKFLDKSDISANPVVQEGDILWVGGRGNTRPKQNAWDVLRTVAPFLIFF